MTMQADPITGASIFEDVTTEYEKREGGGHYVRTLSDRLWVSVLHRLTGFGYWEWETAIVRMWDDDDPRKGKRGKWDDRDTLIVVGDHRPALSDKNEAEIMEWYADHSGEKNSFETILGTLTPTTP